MALANQAQVEIRDTGAADNGGYYTPTLAGAVHDYSQDNNPIISIGDGDCNNSTTLTSVSALFTSLMVGNGIHISGAGFTTGWYDIRTFNSTSSIVLDRNPTSAGGHPTTGACKVGGALTTPETIAASLTTGSVIHVKKGTYTWGAFTTPVGSTSLPGVIRGFKTTHNDNPVGADRPSITMSGVVTITVDNVIRDLIVSGNFNGRLLNAAAGQRSLFRNVKATQTNVNTSVSAIFAGDNGAIVNCEGICTNGFAFNGTHGLTLGSYAHDSSFGCNVAAAGTAVVNCIVDTCTTGVNGGGTTGNRIVGSTICNCTTGILFSVGTSFAATVLNSIITNCTTGVSGHASIIGSIIDDFNVYNNTTDVSNWTKGTHSITANPLLVDPANGDFRLQAGSPAINAAMQIGANFGVLGEYFDNIGVFKSTRSEGQVSATG